METEEVQETNEPAGMQIEDIYVPPPPPVLCSLDNAGPRLVIVKIVNEFFKSYGGKRTLGPFHKNFSAIIGPNGSGKSNVIDSMLFVFGFRAQKIRSKKLSVLIHNSDSYPDNNSCTVSVHFAKILDKDTEFEMIPDSEFVISRTAFKDNSSYYQINGKKATFKEVTNILKSQGIDLDHNRFLILQGEVEQIAMMKPKSLGENDCGMLEYLEDVIGSSRFREPISKLNERVEELSERRQEKFNRVKIVEKEKDDLAGPRTVAIDYMKKSNALTRKKSYLYQYFKLIHKDNIKKSEQNLAELDKSLQEGTADLSSKCAQREIQAKELDKITKETNEMNKKLDGLQNDKKSLELEDMRAREDFKRNNQHLKRNNLEIKKLLKEKESCEKTPGENAAEMKELTSHEKGLENEIAVLQDKLDKFEEELKSILKPYNDEKRAIEPEFLQLQEAVHSTQIDKRSVQSELDMLLTKEHKETTKYESLTSKLNECRQSLEQRHKSLEEMQSLVPDYKSNYEQVCQQLKALSEEESHILKKLHSLRLQIEESKSSTQASSSRNRVLNLLLNEKKNGRLKGICGRLGDLGAIDAKYDVAISTACGALNHIVVDNTKTATDGLEFLKVNKVGFATFVALDKMEIWRERSKRPVKFPQNVPRLFDLVKMKDELYRGVFYSALRDTLVADNLDQAAQIGLGANRHRVVTLQGQLIEITGTMSGGGNKVMRGAMGSSIAHDSCMQESDIKNKEREVAQLSKRLEELSTSKVELEQTVCTCKEELKTFERNRLKAQQDVKSLEQQILSYENQLKSVRKNLDQCRSQEGLKEDLTKKLDEKQKACELASAQHDKVKVKMDKVNSKIKEKTDGKTKKTKLALSEATDKLKKTSKRLCELQVSISTAERKLVTVEDNIVACEQAKLDYEEQIKVLQGQMIQYEISYKESEEAIKLVEEQLTSCDNRRHEVRTMLDTCLSEENALKVSMTNIKRDIDMVKAVISEENKAMMRADGHLSSLQLYKIDEEEHEDLQTFTEEDLRKQDYDYKTQKYNITQEETELENEKPNLAILKDYQKVLETYIARVADLDQVTKERDQFKKHYETLRTARLHEFMDGFSVITKKLKEIYQMITLGGDAELDMVDNLDPFSEGIAFSVRPPKKSWKTITYLSGGEKTLASLSLVFALHHYCPTCLYVMDEIDAALDFRNVSIIANYIKERTKNAQFIIISLRTQMFEIADRLVGIYKTYNTTKTVTIEPHAILSMGQRSNATSHKRKLTE